MKFNPKCSAKNLQIWINNIGDELVYFDASLFERDGVINIDGWVNSEQIELINQWIKAHK